MHRALTTSLLILGFAGPSMAAAQVDAPVVDVQPIYRSTPTTTAAECLAVPSSSSRDARLARVLGGLAGGYAGSQIGAGSGRDLATIAGAIVGSEYAASRTRGTQRRCNAAAFEAMEQEEQVVEGYDVIYRHAGRLWRTRRSEPPGDSINVPDRRVQP